MRRLFPALAAFAAFAVAIIAGLPVVPDRWVPWAPLHLADEPNLLTAGKLRRLADRPALCGLVLARSSFRAAPVPDRVADDGCALVNAVRISDGTVPFQGGIVATCPLAVALALWQRHTVAPAAAEILGEPVVAIDHLGSYACRNVYGRETGRRSQHATANAVDIAAFRTRSGRRVSVLDDWDDDGRDGRFLRAVHSGGCAIFGAVLGPEYNAAHRNHFHLDLGRYAACR